jgi:hypothetical protein
MVGSGVTFYNTGDKANPYGPINFTNIDAQISAPTSGTNSGMLIMQDPLNTQNAILSSNTNTFFKGNIYFPNNDLLLKGNGSTAIQLGSVVASSIRITGGNSFNLVNTYVSGGVSSLRAGLYQ